MSGPTSVEWRWRTGRSTMAPTHATHALRIEREMAMTIRTAPKINRSHARFVRAMVASVLSKATCWR